MILNCLRELPETSFCRGHIRLAQYGLLSTFGSSFTPKLATKGSVELRCVPTLPSFAVGEGYGCDGLLAEV